MPSGIRGTMFRRPLGLRALMAVVLAVIAACAGPTPSPGPPGRLLVTVQLGPVENPLFEPVRRARAVSVDGAIDVGWRLEEGAAPVEVPPGTYRLEAFTVFLSDFIQCTDTVGPAGPTSTCLQPTLGPSQVCAIDVDVVAAGDVTVVYRELDQGRCQLELGSALPT